MLSANLGVRNAALIPRARSPSTGAGDGSAQGEPGHAEDKLNREREDLDSRENMLAEGTEALT
jgi:hypothetical protein